MSWKDNLLLGLLGVGLAVGWKENREDKARMKTNCSFSKGITKKEFESIAHQTSVGIKRLKEIYVEGPVVHGTVRSQSGLNIWTFKIDFNDYGHVTGNYWIYSDNSDSDIPKFFANKIQESIYGR
mgnify:CR=1 FL=1